MTKKTSNWQLIIQTLALVSQLGLTMLGSIAIGFFFGRVIDQAFGYEFFITLIFMIVGVVAGFWSVYRMVRVYIESQKKDDSK